VLAFAPWILVIAFIGGSADGASALIRKEPVFLARLKNQYREREWYVLRNLSSGLIVHDLSVDHLEYVKWDDVASFTSKIGQPNRNGLICRISGYLCRPDTTASELSP